jgi:hypothetical protein
MRKKRLIVRLVILVFFISPLNKSVAQQRHNNQKAKQYDQSQFSHEWGEVVSLDGEWDIAEGNRQQVPVQFSAKVPVPGLVTSATPKFTAVG